MRMMHRCKSKAGVTLAYKAISTNSKGRKLYFIQTFHAEGRIIAQSVSTRPSVRDVLSLIFRFDI